MGAGEDNEEEHFFVSWKKTKKSTGGDCKEDGEEERKKEEGEGSDGDGNDENISNNKEKQVQVQISKRMKTVVKITNSELAD